MDTQKHYDQNYPLPPLFLQELCVRDEEDRDDYFDDGDDHVAEAKVCYIQEAFIYSC